MSANHKELCGDFQTTRLFKKKLQGVVGVISWPIPGGQSDSFSIAFGVVSCIVEHDSCIFHLRFIFSANC